MELALVVPVYKKGEKGCVDNYRPISLTCLAMKVFERCIHKELLSKCGQFKDPRQHGFVNNRSCTTQMMPFIDDLALTLNTISRSDIIYFDFAKAFDSVSHNLILQKLKNLYGIDGLMLRFIKSYLQGRQQKVLLEEPCLISSQCAQAFPKDLSWGHSCLYCLLTTFSPVSLREQKLLCALTIPKSGERLLDMKTTLFFTLI